MRWYETGNDSILMAQFHSQIRFYGEMLAEISKGASSTEELHSTARKYGLNWSAHTQVDRRRGWLQSAGMIEPTDGARLTITDAGRGLLTRLELFHPLGIPELADPMPTPAPPAITPIPEIPPPLASVHKPDAHEPGGDLTPAEGLADEIRAASTDSQNPDRLEFAVRDAFQFLGFDAEKLGGSGKTDVLVEALLGRDDSYTVAIDAKTVGAGSLGDGQVDWVTLDEHKRQHSADYSMLVGPNPSGKRLMNRAVGQLVAVLSTDQLADLCIQHADAPLGLQDYRAHFETGGAVDMTSINKAAQDLARLRELATELLATLADQTNDTGPLTARDLWLLMRNHPSGKASSELEIQQMLDTLASPLVAPSRGQLQRDTSERLPRGSPKDVSTCLETMWLVDLKAQP